MPDAPTFSRLATAVLVVFVIALGACRDAQDPIRSGPGPSLSGSDCWPPSETCTERGLDPEEEDRIGGGLLGMDTRMAECWEIQNRAFSDLNAGNMRMQTSPPYMPNQAGDRHNGPEITHFVLDFFEAATDSEVAAIAIHETAHALGWDDAAAYYFESQCMLQ